MIDEFAGIRGIINGGLDLGGAAALEELFSSVSSPGVQQALVTVMNSVEEAMVGVRETATRLDAEAMEEDRLAKVYKDNADFGKF